MAFKFDVTLKETVKEDVAGYAARFGRGAGRPASLLNVDLSTLSMATDVAIGVGDPLEEIADLNFQSGPDPRLEDRLLLYNSALRFRYGVLVRSILILLRPKADSKDLKGLLTYGDEEHRVEFRYEVVRVWREPAESFLKGSIGLVPLAILGKLPAGRPIDESANEIARQVEARLLAETSPQRAMLLMKATTILASLRFEKNDLSRVLQGVGLMGEMAAADYFAEQGAIGKLQKALIRVARKKFGHSDEEAESSLTFITDVDRLERMLEATVTAVDWQELLNTP